MRTYTGKRHLEGVVVEVNREPLPLRLELINHSPTGFEWGYGGSGPAQLALAILADYYAPDFPTVVMNPDRSRLALRSYQAFKWDVVAKLPDEWTLTTDDIETWLRGQK